MTTVSPGSEVRPGVLADDAGHVVAGHQHGGANRHSLEGPPVDDDGARGGAAAVAIAPMVPVASVGSVVAGSGGIAPTLAVPMKARFAGPARAGTLAAAARPRRVRAARPRAARAAPVRGDGPAARLPLRRHPDLAARLRATGRSRSSTRSCASRATTSRPTSSTCRRRASRGKRQGPGDHHRRPARDGRGGEGRGRARSRSRAPTAATRRRRTVFAGWVARPRPRARAAALRAARPLRAPARPRHRLPQRPAAATPFDGRLGSDGRGQVDEGPRLGVRLRHELPAREARRHLLRLRAVALPVRRPGRSRRASRLRA